MTVTLLHMYHMYHREKERGRLSCAEKGSDTREELFFHFLGCFKGASPPRFGGNGLREIPSSSEAVGSGSATYVGDFQDKNIQRKHSTELSFPILHNGLQRGLVFLITSRSHKTQQDLTKQILASVPFLHVVRNSMICLCFSLSTASFKF